MAGIQSLVHTPIYIFATYVPTHAYPLHECGASRAGVTSSTFRASDCSTKLLATKVQGPTGLRVNYHSVSSWTFDGKEVLQQSRVDLCRFVTGRLRPPRGWLNEDSLHRARRKHQLQAYRGHVAAASSVAGTSDSSTLTNSFPDSASPPKTLHSSTEPLPAAADSDNNSHRPKSAKPIPSARDATTFRQLTTSVNGFSSSDATSSSGEAGGDGSDEGSGRRGQKIEGAAVGSLAVRLVHANAAGVGRTLSPIADSLGEAEVAKLLRTLHARGAHDVALAALDWLRAEVPQALSAEAFHAAIKSAVRAGRYDAAVEMLAGSAALGLAVPARAIRAVAQAVLHGPRAAQPAAICQLADACLRAFERGAVADADTCSLVLASLLSSQQSSPGRGGGGGSGGSSGLTHAVRMLAHMREMRVLPTNVAVKQMLLACNRMAEVDVALKLWRDLRAQGFRPSAHNCTLMIQTFDSVGRVEEVLRLYRDMKRAGIQASAETYLELVSLLGRRECFAEVARIHDDMLQEGVEPGLEILIALLDAYGKGSLWSRVDELLSHISKEGLRKAPQVQTSLMVIYGRAGMFDKMNAEVALMRQTTPVLTLDVYNTLLEVHASAPGGGLSECVRLLCELEATGRTPDVRTFLSLITAFGHAGHYPEAEGLVGYMRERFNVKYMHFNAILAVYARAARWDDVAAWLARVRMAGIRPSLGNYNRIAFSFPHGRADLWERLLGEMRRDRVRPSFNTYRGLLGTHVHAARFGAALGVYRASLSKHPLLQAEPDLCPSLLGLCWWHLRLLEARQVLSSMEHTLGAPDAASTCALIGLYGGLGLWEDARRAFERFEAGQEGLEGDAEEEGSHSHSHSHSRARSMLRMMSLLLEAYVQARQVAAAEALLARIRETAGQGGIGGIEGLVSSQQIRLYGFAQDVPRMLEVAGGVIATGGAELRHYTALVEVAVREGRAEEALDFAETAAKAQLSGDPALFTALFRVGVRVTGGEQAERLLALLRELGLPAGVLELLMLELEEEAQGEEEAQEEEEEADATWASVQSTAEAGSSGSAVEATSIGSPNGAPFAAASGKAPAPSASRVAHPEGREGLGAGANGVTGQRAEGSQSGPASFAGTGAGAGTGAAAGLESPGSLAERGAEERPSSSVAQALEGLEAYARQMSGGGVYGEAQRAFFNALVDLLWALGLERRAARAMGVGAGRGLYPAISETCAGTWVLNLRYASLGSAQVALVAWLAAVVADGRRAELAAQGALLAESQRGAAAANERRESLGSWSIPGPSSASGSGSGHREEGEGALRLQVLLGTVTTAVNATSRVGLQEAWEVKGVVQAHLRHLRAPFTLVSGSSVDPFDTLIASVEEVRAWGSSPGILESLYLRDGNSPPALAELQL